ncbi:MAG TPA: DUF4258 domain-containing protein [Planctomycetota bacterium]|nr:DUF4258 domain-containing protein [Planctomycetota bacterium]
MLRLAPEPLYACEFTPHALRAMQRRRISFAWVYQVLQEPDARAAVRPGRERIGAAGMIGDDLYIVTVVVGMDRFPPEVVTVFRTRVIDREEASSP